MEPDRAPKRFYKDVTVAEGGGGFAVALDGRQMRTPGEAALVVPGAALAEAIAGEWRRQGERIDPDDMPFTRLASTAIDRIVVAREEAVRQLMRFGETDLLCYRVSAPEELARRQHEAWQPLLDWAAETLGARLEVTHGLIPIPQPGPALGALEVALSGYGAMALAGLGLAVPASGSLVIGFALAEGRIEADAACRFAELEESYQNERWGEDEETLETRRRVRADIHAAAGFLALSREHG